MVWSSIVDHVDEPEWDDDWITVTDMDASEPLDASMVARGGWCSRVSSAAIEAAVNAERLGRRLRARPGSPAPGGDDALCPRLPCAATGWRTLMIRAVDHRANLFVTSVTQSREFALVPYSKAGELLPLDEDARGHGDNGLCRTELQVGNWVRGETAADSGKPWWGWYRWVRQARSALRSPSRSLRSRPTTTSPWTAGAKFSSSPRR